MSNKTILVADDDRDLAQAIAARCRRLGHIVETAYDSLTALSRIRECAPDLVCLDVNMPAGNGMCVCEMMASEPAWASIPVIILTGKTDPETIKRCHQLCAYYVPKGEGLWERLRPLLFEFLSETSVSHV